MSPSWWSLSERSVLRRTVTLRAPTGVVHGGRVTLTANLTLTLRLFVVLSVISVSTKKAGVASSDDTAPLLQRIWLL